MRSAGILRPTVVALLAALATLTPGCSTTQSVAGPSTTRILTVATFPFGTSTPEGDGTRATTTTGKPPTGVSVARDVVYNSAGRLDVYKPAKPGGPLVVLFPGRTSDKALYAKVAAALAVQGAAVVVPNYRAKDLLPVPASDARCVIRTARLQASQWNADPSRLVLLGFTWGVMPAMGEALGGPWQNEPAPEDCVLAAAAPGPVPELPVKGVVGVVGQYDWFDSGGVESDLYKKFSPFSQVSGTNKIPVRLITGQPDELAVPPATTTRFRDALIAAGFTASTELSSLPNLALLGARYDTATKTVVIASERADRSGVDLVVQTVLAVAG